MFFLIQGSFLSPYRIWSSVLPPECGFGTPQPTLKIRYSSKKAIEKKAVYQKGHFQKGNLPKRPFAKKATFKKAIKLKGQIKNIA